MSKKFLISTPNFPNQEFYMMPRFFGMRVGAIVGAIFGSLVAYKE
jgi:hypothetical protein